jgi:7-cyano-7-deazaguanine synthase
VDYAHTWTCYQPQGQGARARACRRCDACRLRAEGFQALALTDPLA